MSLKAGDEDNEPLGEGEEELAIIEGFPQVSMEIYKKLTQDFKPVRSFDNYLSVESESSYKSLIEDCNVAFTAEPKDDDEAYSLGTTFFIPSHMKPRCLLEKLALDVFNEHVKELDDGEFDPKFSGAEFWTLVMDAEANIGDENADDEEEDDIGIHFDADYGLEEALPCLIHPHISTITYLSDIGVPTLILNKHSPPPEDEGKVSLAGPIEQGYLSYPKIGKHIAFDGRMLHGASAAFFPSSPASSSAGKNSDGKRITFLVNIWLNHSPLDAEVLPEEIVKQMKPVGDYYKLGSLKSPDTLDSMDLKAQVPGEGAKEFVAEAVQTVVCNREVTFVLNLDDVKKANTDIQEKAGTGGTVELKFENESLALFVGDEVSDDEDNDEEEEE